MAGKREASWPALGLERYAPPDMKIKSKLGGGVLKELVIRELTSKKVIHYALAYINANIYAGDNGRVLGYDNRHDYSHKHYYGTITPEPFVTYEALYEKFQSEWMDIALRHVNGERRL